MLSVDGNDLCRVHFDPSNHPVSTQVTKTDPHGNHVKAESFFVRLANGTREVTDETEIQRYIAQRWNGSR
jgi:hypothetical protein